MTSTRRALLRAGGGVLAGGLLAGCIDDSTSEGESADTAATPEPTPSGPWTVTGRANDSTTRSTGTRRSTSGETTPGTTAVNRGCNGARYLSFYPSDRRGWTRQTIYVAYSLRSGANVALVVFEGETALGTEDFSSPGGAAVDGQPIRLDEPLIGEHTIRVVMYADQNRMASSIPRAPHRVVTRAKWCKRDPKLSISVRSRRVRRRRKWVRPGVCSRHRGVGV